MYRSRIISMRNTLIIANVFLVLATLGLVVITWRYTSHTKRMKGVLICLKYNYNLVTIKLSQVGLHLHLTEKI